MICVWYVSLKAWFGFHKLMFGGCLIFLTLLKGIWKPFRVEQLNSLQKQCSLGQKRGKKDPSYIIGSFQLPSALLNMTIRLSWSVLAMCWIQLFQWICSKQLWKHSFLFGLTFIVCRFQRLCSNTGWSRGRAMKSLLPTKPSISLYIL